MIVVIGAVAARRTGSGLEPSGVASAVARGAATAGGRVEVVARLGDDSAGDAVLLAFARDGVGHVATLRDPARPTRIVDPEAGDGDGDVDPAADPPSLVAGDPAVDPETAPAPTLDAADVDLALRYLDEYRVLVLVDPTDQGVLGAVSGAARWASAHLVVLTEAAGLPDDAVPTDSLVLAVPAGGDGIGALVGRYAAAVDAGSAPAEAYRLLAADGGSVT